MARNLQGATPAAERRALWIPRAKLEAEDASSPWSREFQVAESFRKGRSLQGLLERAVFTRAIIRPMKG